MATVVKMANDNPQPTWEERVAALNKGLEKLRFKTEGPRNVPAMTQAVFREWAEVMKQKIALLLVAAQGHDSECES